MDNGKVLVPFTCVVSADMGGYILVKA